MNGPFDALALIAGYKACFRAAALFTEVLIGPNILVGGLMARQFGVLQSWGHFIRGEQIFLTM